MKCKVRKNGSQSKEAKMVNFVIFVVNGIAVLKSMDSEDEGKKYTQMIATTFNCPYLSFKGRRKFLILSLTAICFWISSKCTLFELQISFYSISFEVFSWLKIRRPTQAAIITFKS